MTLPVQLSGFSTLADGIGWLGPFISSAGNVYVVGVKTSDNTLVAVWKATDPTSSFTEQTSWQPMNTTARSVSVHQVGDTLWVSVHSGLNYMAFRPWSMSSDSWAASAVGTAINSSPINGGIAGVRRSTGSDFILFYNTTGVTNMGKTYGRIAARRSAGSTSSLGNETQIGLGLISNTCTESVDSAVLGTSDRVHLFWTRTNTTSGGASTVYGRTVKSSDNLDGTAPATAEFSVVQSGLNNTVASDSHHASGQSFCSSAGELMVPVHAGASVTMRALTATSADTPSWTSTQVSSSLGTVQLTGNTTLALKTGGAPYDGTNKTMAWVQNSSLQPFYDKDTGSGWGTDTHWPNDSLGLGSPYIMSANVFQRGTNIVLAGIYTQSINGPVYDEIVLRTSGLSGAITPVTITLTPQALTAGGSGDASRTLTPATFTLTPVALTASEGNVTTSISPVIFTLTPVELTGQSTIEPQYASISPVQLSLLPQPLSTSIGDVASTITPVALNLAPVALTTSIGGVSRDIGAATFTVTPVALSTSQAVSVSITPVVIRFTPTIYIRGGIIDGSNDAYISTPDNPARLSTAVDIRTKTKIDWTQFDFMDVAKWDDQGHRSWMLAAEGVAWPRKIGWNRSADGSTWNQTFSTVTMPSGWVDGETHWVRVVFNGNDGAGNRTFKFYTCPSEDGVTWVQLGTTVTIAGTTSLFASTLPIVIGPGNTAGATVYPGWGIVYKVEIRSSEDGTIIASPDFENDPVVGSVLTDAQNNEWTLHGTASIDSPPTLEATPGNVTCSIEPAIFTLTPQEITGSGTGDASRDLTPVIFTLTPIVLNVLGGPSTTYISPAIFALTPVALTTSVGEVSGSITPATFTLTPVALNTSVGDASRDLGVVIFTLIPVELTGYALTPGEGNISPVIFTLTPVALTALEGNITTSISPVQLTLSPVVLTPSIGDVSVSLGPVTLTLSPTTLTLSVGDVSATIDPVQLMLIAVALSILSGVGGKIKVWTGTQWVEEPIFVWMGSSWVEKPLKVWTGSTWELT